jgi:C1A family cysteine protease
MRTFILSVFAAATSALSQTQINFMKWVVDHQRSYNTVEEYTFRYKQYLMKDAKYKAMNKILTTSTVGHNDFSDWTDEEFQNMLGYKAEEGRELKTKKLATFSMEYTVNWVTAGAVTPVKNQGACGSCWSFSATGAMEGAHFIYSGTLLSLSEQQLVACSYRYGNLGCGGGLMDNAFMYAMNTAMDTEEQYPYTGWYQCKTCELTIPGTVNVTSYYDVVANDPDQLKAAINMGPVSVAIQANQPAFQGYTGGIITAECGTNLDHGVLAVGYGIDNGVEFYLVKNSWGPDWGEAGYVRIGIEAGAGVCGIQSGPPSQPTTN